MQKELARQAIEKLREFPEATKLVGFGSVYKNHYRSTADIDIAFICADFFRSFPLDAEGIPIGLITKIKSVLSEIKNESNIPFHVPVYWEGEFERGIELYSGRRLPPDLLHEVGIIIYDRETVEI